MYRRIIYVCIYRCYIKYSGRYWQHHFLYVTKTFAIFIQLQHTATTPITKRKRRKYIKERQLCIAVILYTYIIPYIEDRKSIDVKVANVGELWVRWGKGKVVYMLCTNVNIISILRVAKFCTNTGSSCRLHSFIPTIQSTYYHLPGLCIYIQVVVISVSLWTLIHHTVERVEMLTSCD